MLEALRTANRLSNRDLFEWQFYAPNNETVTSNSGIMVPTIPLSDASNLQTLIICAPAEAHRFNDAVTLNLLKKFDKQDVKLGTASFGSFVLASAGLLDHCRSTVHWEHIPVFKELYPQLDVAFTLYEIDEKRFTCSGGTAALDMMLKINEPTRSTPRAGNLTILSSRSNSHRYRFAANGQSPRPGDERAENDRCDPVDGVQY